MHHPSSAARGAPGALLAGRYRLVRSIGEGAMGVVWAARDERAGRDVAVKLIVRPDQELRLRLAREARACSVLRHPNIIELFDFAETEDGEPFLAMELLTGETVGERLARTRRFEPELAARIGRDVAGALAAAHGSAIIHRDLKPANIFLHRLGPTDDFVVKVLDFGISKNLGVSDGMHTAIGSAVGSPFYMSPEQVRGLADMDYRADLWALGVVLFEMLTGVRPFQGQTAEVYAQILSEEIPTVDRFVRHVDPGLVQIVTRCMQRDRNARVGSATELAGLLTLHAGRAPAPSWAGVGPPAAPPWRAPQPSHPSMAGAGAATADDPDDMPTTLFDPEAIRAAGRRASSPHLPGVAPFAEGKGGTIRLTPESAAAIGVTRESGAQFAPPPSLGAYGAPGVPGPLPGGMGAGPLPGGMGAGPLPGGMGAGPLPGGMGAGPLPGAPAAASANAGSSVTPLVRTPAGVPWPAADPLAAGLAPGPPPRGQGALIGLLVGLVLALGVIGVSLFWVLSGPSAPAPAAAASSAVPPEAAAEPPASAPEPPASAPEPPASAPVASAPPAASAPAAAVTAAPTVPPAKPPVVNRPPAKRDCSKLKLLERQKCLRGQ